MMHLFSSWTGMWTGGIPLPYSPHADDGVALVLFGCFFVGAYVLSRCRKYLADQMSDFLLNRERASLFATADADVRYKLALMLQTCVLSGLFLFCYFCDVSPALPRQAGPGALLWTYIGLCVVFLALKWLCYIWLGWIFFDKNLLTKWLDSYFTLIYYLGFALFPCVLFAVYFESGTVVSVCFALFLLVLMKILMFYKWLKFFYSNIHGCIVLIFYFCALEIIPCLMLYRLMIQMNECLVLKI